ncbi:MAG: 4Fe-4S dicluster domain-containing protein [Acidobacteriota bacterium]|nr:4Fe-4S dicluster domain-containing protein [Acidobacteriota bacterium]MDP3716373.1 4Fe-4S dicluster domain-containing protein [Acidobacteriota bacterium]
MRYAMAIDTRLCVGCMNCVVACKNENQVPEGYCRDWITETVRGEFPDLRLEIRSERCNHCDRPPCVSCCPTGASYRREDGIVLVDKSKCIGCKACMAACPYDARFVHPDGYISKCTFCHHLVDQGQDPACVSSCPTRCMHFGDVDDPDSAISRLLRRRAHHTLLPDTGCGPHCFFLV